MFDYEEKRKKIQTNSVIAGIAVTVFLHIAGGTYFYTSGLVYLDPPPPDLTNIMVDFEEMLEEEKEKPEWSGRQPRSEDPDRTRKTEIVKRSEGLEKGSKQNIAEASQIDEFGEVEKAGEKQPEINKRALFKSANNLSKKDTLAPQTSYEPSEKLEDGHALGNSQTGTSLGEPNANLKGRNSIGTLPKPNYKGQATGTVVVSIIVRSDGTVEKANPGAPGTTVTNAIVWNEARKAAMSARFTPDTNRDRQQGTITYIFKVQ